MITGIDVVFLHVHDPAKMVDWYQEVLGLQLGFQTTDLHWQEFKMNATRPPTRFGLDYVRESKDSIENQKVMISFGVKDIYKTIENLEKKGVQFFGTPTVVDAGPTLFATTRDPEGNWLQFSQRK